MEKLTNYEQIILKIAIDDKIEELSKRIKDMKQAPKSLQVDMDHENKRIKELTVIIKKLKL